MHGQYEHDVPRAAARRVDGEKKSLIATEQDPRARAAWWEEMVAVPAERLVFVDETGTHTRMTPLYGRAPRGQRAYGHVPRNHTHNTTLVAALTLVGPDAPMVLEGAMDREAFLAWLRHFLVPTLSAGQVVVMDNLNVHKGTQVRAMIEAAGCELVYLPAYSPDFSPIEGAYSKVKARVRRAGKRTQGELEAAIGEAVGAVTARDARGWFAHCGYRLSGQSS
jgi:transposase